MRTEWEYEYKKKKKWTAQQNTLFYAGIAGHHWQEVKLILDGPVPTDGAKRGGKVARGREGKREGGVKVGDKL